MEAEGLRFIYCAILPQTDGFVNTFSKNFIFFLQGKNFSRPNTQIHCNLRIRTAPGTSQSPVFRVAVRRGEQTFTTTRMSIGKINKILCKNPIEILTGSCFHEISRQKSSTLLIYKSLQMRYNNLARRKQAFRRKNAAQVGLCGISISWYQACKDAKRCIGFVRPGYVMRAKCEAGSVYTDSVFSLPQNGFFRAILRFFYAFFEKSI